MSDTKDGSNLSKDSPSLKDFLNEKEEGWYVLAHYISDLGLSFVDAGLYTILVNLSFKHGYGFPSSEFLCTHLGLKESKSIRNKLEILRQKNLIYIHFYQTQAGKRREIVTVDSAARYAGYLRRNQRWSQLKKFQTEFLDKIGMVPPSSPPTSGKPEVKAKVVKNQPGIKISILGPVKNTGPDR